MMKSFVLASVASFFVVAPGGAQDAAEAGGATVQTLRLAGSSAPILYCHVVTGDAGVPIPGAQVFLDGTRIGALSDESGFVELPIPDAGEWLLRVRLIGYHEERLRLDLAGGTLTQVLVGLRIDSLKVRTMSPHAPPPVPVPRDTLR